MGNHSGDDYEPDAGRVQERAIERQDDRTDRVERLLGLADEILGDVKYPVTSEELATEYADQQIDLPNETESLGSVFDRLVDERFESAAEAREAVYAEVTGEADGISEYNDERALEHLEATEEDHTSNVNDH